MRMWASASLRLRAAAAATTEEAFSFTIMKVKDTPAKYAPATHRIRPAFTPQVWHGAGGYRGSRSAERLLHSPGRRGLPKVGH